MKKQDAIEGVVVLGVERESLPSDAIHILTKGKYKGLTVEIRQPDPEFLVKMQSVFTAVKIPKPPKYYARTLSGKMEEHYMDELASKQTPGGETQWANYQERLREAKTEQNQNVALAIMFYGTDFTLPLDGWEDDQMFLGIIVPQNKDQKKAHFLVSEIDQEDIASIITKVMRSAGMDEETVKEAEDSFRLAVSPES